MRKRASTSAWRPRRKRFAEKRSAFFLNSACEKNIRAVLEELAGLDDMLLAEPTVIRVED